MHELSIAMELHRMCRSEVEAQGGGRLEAVRVAVGELSGVEPDLLQFAWEAVAEEAGDGRAALAIEWRAARQTCPECGAAPDREAGAWLRACPGCGAPLRVEGGWELDLLRIEFEPVEVPREACT